MKRKWNHPEAPRTGKHYWRSLGEKADTPEFRQWLEREFPAGAAEMEDGDVSRRSFLKLMGAATALAGFGMSGCRRPEEYLIPWSSYAEWSIPGNPLFYATAMPTGTGCVPLVATTHDGRPTKLEGNPLHPGSTGAADGFAQASILDLYDPDRVRRFTRDGKESTKEAFLEAIQEANAGLTSSGGDGLAFLLGESTSPTLARLQGELRKRFPKAQWFRHEPLAPEPARQAAAIAFGEGVKPVPNFEKAQKILSLDCDFLGLERTGVNPVPEFSRGRQVEKIDRKAGKLARTHGMNRLYVLEPRYTTTGGMADHRLRVRASQILAAAAAIAEKVGVDPGLIPEVDAAGLNEEWIAAAAEDLKDSKGAALVVAGGRLPVAVQLLVHAINETLGSHGNTVTLLSTGESEKVGTIGELAEAAGSGNVSTLIVTTPSDPVFDGPADIDWPGLRGKIKNIVRLAFHRDRTAGIANWTVPAAHYLEAWGDARAEDGVYSVMQPMILPLHGGMSEIELCLELLKDVKPEGEAAPAPAPVLPTLAITRGAELKAGDELKPAMEEVRKTFGEIAGEQDLDKNWSACLRDGHLPESAFKPAAGAFDPGAAETGIAGAPPVSKPEGGSLEVVFTADYSLYDGRYANNGWLQEAPDPVTKLTWDNAALLSPKTAKAHGLKVHTGGELETAEMVKVSVNGRELELPALVAPGHADGSISIALGYSQERELGRVAEKTGFDAYRLRTSGTPYFALGATLSKTGAEYPIALTQEHNSMEGRALARDGVIAEFDADEKFSQVQGLDSHIPPNISLYRGQIGRKSEDNPHGFDYENELQWGMTIDLNTCLGCNACLVACQAENNIPIVGKDQVRRGREMHWIRLDRYYAHYDEHDDDPEMIPQPVACQQCESAPCETVCPVNATVHNDEGLNVMAYNRCIGTRYCANNCPYKARRFNFFDYNKRPLDELYKGPLSSESGMPGSMRLQKNPNVTVRMRGVMEKCTYCVQRLQEAKIQRRRKVRDSDDLRLSANSVKVACQQACPAEAINFGDVALPKSDVTLWQSSGRNYELLKYVGTHPRTTYLARIKNPNPRMPDAARKGKATGGGH